MNPKVRSILSIVLAAIVLALLFIPGFYLFKIWAPERNAYGYVQHVCYTRTIVPCTFLSSLAPRFEANPLFVLVGALFLLCVQGTVAVAILRLILKERMERLSKGLLRFFDLLPVLSAVLMAVYTPLVNACCRKPDDWSYYVEYEIQPLFYVTMVILAAHAILGIVFAFSRKKEAAPADDAPAV